jgi:hypothetical protein
MSAMNLHDVASWLYGLAILCSVTACAHVKTLRLKRLSLEERGGVEQRDSFSVLTFSLKKNSMA